MKTQCSNCRCKGGHEVIKTNPDLLHWNDKAAVEMFERIAGYDLSFRCHTRRCIVCERRFDAVEVSFHHLSALIGEALRAGELAHHLAEERGKVDAL